MARKYRKTICAVCGKRAAALPGLWTPFVFVRHPRCWNALDAALKAKSKGKRLSAEHKRLFDAMYENMSRVTPPEREVAG